MTWEWSHTQEAYCHARQNVQNKSRKWLEDVFAEWKSWNRDDDSLDEDKYHYWRCKARGFPADVLADHIWDEMSELARCDNGGWNAHCCPFGCELHKVPFDLEKSDEEKSVDEVGVEQ